MSHVKRNASLIFLSI